MNLKDKWVAPTPQKQRNWTKIILLVLAIVGAIHAAIMQGALSLPKDITNYLILAEIILSAIVPVLESKVDTAALQAQKKETHS